MTKLEVLEAVSWPAEPGSPTAGPPPPGSTEGQDRLIAAYDHAGVGIAEVDGEGTLLRVNAHLCRLTGYSSRELLGGSIFAGSHPEDVETDREQLCRQRAGEIDRYRVEKRIRRKDGGYFWAAVTSSIVCARRTPHAGERFARGYVNSDTFGKRLTIIGCGKKWSTASSPRARQHGWA